MSDERSHEGRFLGRSSCGQMNVSMTPLKPRRKMSSLQMNRRNRLHKTEQSEVASSENEQPIIKQSIRIIRPCDLYPLAPHPLVKLGLQGVYIFSYFCSKHRLWVHFRGGSNEYLLSVKTRKYVYPSTPQFYYIKVGCNMGTHLLIAIIDASWKVNAYYNGVCMRRGDCYVSVIHLLCPWTVCITWFAFLS